MRIALLSYRSKPHSGGQGIYVRNLSRELVALGHDVEVFSGQPYPELDAGVTLTALPSLDLYRDPDPFRTPRLGEIRDGIDVLEVLHMYTAGFPEPLTFSLRAARALWPRLDEFDVIHDNQTLGYGLLRLVRSGTPVVTTIHHPITFDRRMEIRAARGWRKVTAWRWYGFVTMQGRVARRMPSIVTVSDSSRRDIAGDFGVDQERIRTIPLGVSPTMLERPPVDRVSGRIVAVASADTPLKGVPTLMRAMARLRGRQPLELIVVGRPSPGGPTERLVADLALGDMVRFVHGLQETELADLLGSAEVACVPSLYEGFSLPTLEAMARGTALVVTRAGAIPEVVGTPGECALLVEPGDDDELAGAIAVLLDDPARRARMGEAGRERAVSRYSWRTVAEETVDTYVRAIDRTMAKEDAEA